MTDGSDDAVMVRLRAVAIAAAMPLGPGLDEAIGLAGELVATGLGGPATVDVACLPRGAVRSDAEPLVRAMLAEWGITVPHVEDASSRYLLLLWSFGYWDLSIELFLGPFYGQLLAWDLQSPLDRTLLLLLEERDIVSTPGERERIETQMRTAVRAAIPPTEESWTLGQVD